MPRPVSQHSPAPASAPAKAGAKPVALADANSAAAAAPPPHRLWETLESAYAAPAPAPDPTEPRLACYIAIPIMLGVSLLLWVAIVELVLMR